MKLNTDDLKGHLSAVITVFQETTNIIFEDENNGRWIYFMLLRELEEILNDLHIRYLLFFYGLTFNSDNGIIYMKKVTAISGSSLIIGLS